jgi:signal-transduction protein with cAMP-binding, CBS, and nucleotidyltransferase domain
MELSRNLRVESVSRLWPATARLVGADRPVADAVAAMKEYRAGCILVTHGGRLVGIFTERDLLTRLLATGLTLSTPLRECMTPRPVTVGLREPVRTAIQKMQDGAYRHLPVVDEENRPVGVLSAKRIVRYLVEHFPSLVYNHPPDPTNHIPRMAEGA